MKLPLNKFVISIYSFTFLVSYSFALSDFKTQSDSIYLSDLPELTNELRRWFIPADEWASFESYEMKGEYYFVEKFYTKKINIFNESSMQGKPFLEDVNCSGFRRNKVLICSKKSFTPKVQVQKYSECGYLFCSKKTGRQTIQLYPYFDDVLVQYERGRGHTDKKCHFKFECIEKHSPLNLQKPSIRYFKALNINEKNGSLEILVNQDRKYIDLKTCFDGSVGSCGKVSFEKSTYEKEWIELRKHREQKDISQLNDLIAFLLPCVKKGDIECVKKYFISPGDLNTNKTPSLLSFKFNVEFNEELLKDLNHCLNYENLLPHLLGTKGINRVCVFNQGQFPDSLKPPKGNTKMISVVYPEAVRKQVEHNELINVEIR